MLKTGVRSSSRPATFFRFACVGGTISLIDAGVLYLLKDAPGFNVYLARIVSYAAAMTAGYLLNRYFTFHHLDRVRLLWQELLRFFSVFAAGGLVNYAVFSLIVTWGAHLDLTRFEQAVLPLVAIWVGGLFGMSFNYFMSHKLVFDE